jgi:hypothetical protein
VRFARVPNDCEGEYLQLIYRKAQLVGLEQKYLAVADLE